MGGITKKNIKTLKLIKSNGFASISFFKKIEITMDQKLKNEIQILVNNYKYGDFKKVLSKCSSLVKKYPKNDFLWNLTGLSFQRIGNQENAVTSFKNAIDHNQKK